jgi:uncharacterized protein YecT (DUF1311 family)
MTAVQIDGTRALRLLLGAIGLLLILGIFAISSARAAENCEDAMSTAEMVQCVGKSLDAANEELVNVYNRLYERLDPERKAQLEAAQDAWEIYRDRNAEFVASAAEGGTLYSVLSLAEMLEMTRRRSDELQERLEESD